MGRGLGLSLVLALGLGFFILVSVGLLASFRWLEGNDFFTLRQVEVRGMDRLTAEEVVVLAGVEQGGSLLDVPIGKVMERLTAYPWIASAMVRRELPDSLRIMVQEKTPVWWLADENGLVYADASGEPIAPVLPDHFASLPVLDAEPGAEDLVPDLASDLSGLAKVDPAFRMDRAAWVRVGINELSLYFDAPDLRLTLERGEGGPWQRSIARLAAVWADLGKRGERDGVRYVTVKGGKAWAGTAAAD
jgi:cell division protein FtsQ